MGWLPHCAPHTRRGKHEYVVAAGLVHELLSRIGTATGDPCSCTGFAIRWGAGEGLIRPRCPYLFPLTCGIFSTNATPDITTLVDITPEALYAVV